VGEKDEMKSVITLDKLRKFNEINGYENGPAVDENQNLEEGEGD
jgi:hypothetical protein